MRPGHGRLTLVVLFATTMTCTGCWGDELPSLDRVGAVRTEGGEVSILFAGCPDEGAERVVLNRTDKDFEEIESVLWEIEADSGTTSENAFIVGTAPAGFREVTALEKPLKRGDHVQVVVTSSEVGTIPMSFTVGDLRSDEVLVRQDGYSDRSEFDDRATQSCPNG